MSAPKGASSRATPVQPSRPAGYRLPKSSVLRGYRSFALVLSKGASYVQSPLRLFVLQVASPGRGLRVGFAVSRTIRSAVIRNRVRRRMREAFRMERDRWFGAGGADMDAVWMYTGPADGRSSYEQIKRTMVDLMARSARQQP